MSAPAEERVNFVDFGELEGQLAQITLVSHELPKPDSDEAVGDVIAVEPPFTTIVQSWTEAFVHTEDEATGVHTIYSRRPTISSKYLFENGRKAGILKFLRVVSVTLADGTVL